MKQQNRARLKLLATFMLFLGPLALAYILYYGMHGAIAGKATNNGQLLTPAKPLPEITLRGRDGGTTSGDVFGGQWTFLQVAPEGCGGACRDSLSETLQIWLLLHDERERVQRVLLVGGDSDASHVEKQRRLEVYSGDLKPLWDLISEHAAAEPGTVYLIDPLGNWVLFYPPEQNGAGLYEDTKHLLDLSHIG